VLVAIDWAVRAGRSGRCHGSPRPFRRSRIVPISVSPSRWLRSRISWA
jgi:hypothetical protein